MESWSYKRPRVRASDGMGSAGGEDRTLVARQRAFPTLANGRNIYR